jgi:hypothetical protein
VLPVFNAFVVIWDSALGNSWAFSFFSFSIVHCCMLAGVVYIVRSRHWTRREETEFYRVVSTFGVERDCETGQFIWDKFRTLAKLERKLDNTLTEYFRAFYHMCLKVCHRFSSEEEG